MTDHLASDTHASTPTPTIPPSSAGPKDEARERNVVSSFGGEERLSGEASREAGWWKLSPRRKRCRAFETKWREAKESIEEAIHKLQSIPADPAARSEPARWLVENARLLRSALQETHQLLESIRSLPQIEPETCQDREPRAYLVSAAFLHATAFAFEEHDFAIYFRKAQGHSKFEMGELCALRPLLELVLLEEIGRAAKCLSGGTNEGDEEAKARSCNIPLSVLVTSLREIADADWPELFDQLSEVEHELRKDPAGAYSCMDSESRNLYRSVVQELGSHAEADELKVAQRALELARQARTEWNSDTRLAQRRSHVGYYLVNKGRPLLEKQIGYQPPLPTYILRMIRDWPEVFYLVGIELLIFAIVAFVLSGLGVSIPLVWALLLLLIPATESAVGVMNQLVSFLFPPRPLPKLDFSNGIPKECTSIVAVPTLLISESQVRQLIRDLEIRYLGNRDANLHFALLTDFPDSSQPSDDPDMLAELCSRLVEDLNKKYRDQVGGTYFHFHRHPIYNPNEGAWMGWERKRGKLLDFNNLLRGRYDGFPVKIGDLSVLPEVRYVITLDADTQLPRESARRLVGTLAHPLNRAVIDPTTNTVVEGYGILQPRVAVSVRSANRSRLANIYSGETGFDIYTRAVSDAYQDLMGEGSFTGKGIYEVDVFQRVLSERFPLNAILSHDLIEGAYARAGLVSDIEVIDDYPSHFSAYSRRKHRWVRGDWQIVRWLLPRVPDYSGSKVRNPIRVISRWKILDNLRRSLVESATFVLLLAGWCFLPGGASHWTVAVLALLLIPAYVGSLLVLATLPRVENPRGFLRETGETFVAEQVNVFMLLAFLAHQALVTLDAIVRTVVRLTITHRNLLEWETSAEAEIETGRRSPADLYLKWMPLVSLLVTVLLATLRPKALIAASPVLCLWACSRVLSQWLNKPLRPGSSEITQDDQNLLRQAALRTWGFFRTFRDAETNWLIPDNFQEEPGSLALRISPTNLGLLLNACLAAYELGYLTLREFADETEKTLARARRLSRYRGHFFNWYDIEGLQPIEPLFISTVDSGNLACCLWTLKQGCLQMAERPIVGANLCQGIKDYLQLVIDLADDLSPALRSTLAAHELEAWVDRPQEDVAAWLRESLALERKLSRVREALLRSGEPAAKDLRWWVEETSLQIASLRQLAEFFIPWLLPEYHEVLERGELSLFRETNHLTLNTLPDFLRAVEMRLKMICEDDEAEQETTAVAESMRSLIPSSIRQAESLRDRLRLLSEEADALVREMDFRFLYNPKRRVLSVGYDVTQRHLERSCYELLASEARTATFVAIAKGDIPQESWFHLGRTLTVCAGKRVLLSWSGTMFEYLMPALWMRTYPNTILDQSLRAAVVCQRGLSKQLAIPWGISESACIKRDPGGHYQYYAFGMRGLALRPRTYAGPVVSPYASFIALAVNASAAVDNLRSMKDRGWLGRFGFYEAADFTSSGIQKPGDYELVRCWMSHHQGMILLSVCNLLAASTIKDLFHAEPMVAATERLLHERVPGTVPVDRPEHNEAPEE